MKLKTLHLLHRAPHQTAPLAALLELEGKDGGKKQNKTKMVLAQCAHKVRL